MHTSGEVEGSRRLKFTEGAADHTNQKLTLVSTTTLLHYYTTAMVSEIYTSRPPPGRAPGAAMAFGADQIKIRPESETAPADSHSA